MAPRDGGLGSQMRRLGQRSARSIGGGGGGGGKPSAGDYTTGGGSGAPKPLGPPLEHRVPYQRSGPYSARGGESAAGWRSKPDGPRQNRTPGTIGEIGPRYFEGDEWGPAANGPVAIGALQEYMAASGILTGEWRYGVWDGNTVAAYKSVLEEANAMGLTPMGVIEERGRSVSFGSGSDGSGGSGGGGGGGSWQYDENGNPVFVPDPEDTYIPPPLEIKTTNKDDLRSVFRRSIIDTLGQGWSQAQVDELIEAYNWQEIKVQKDAYDRQVAIERADFEGTRGAGGETISTESVASPEAFLENELIRRDPEGYKAGRLVNDAIPAFMAALGGWTG